MATTNEALPAIDTDAERVRHLLDGQLHCDHFLTPLADPRGRSVLVVGCGAGTEMLWALRCGAREVVGLDVVPQSGDALAAAARSLGVDVAGRARMLVLDVGAARGLGRRFDLVLSNNVFEHVKDLDAAFAACAELVEPDHGRIAIFTAPLYHSADGAHLPLAPWEHLWGDLEGARERLLASDLASTHSRFALGKMSVRDYLDREISLNRMRLADFLAAIGRAGLAIVNLRTHCEPRLVEAPEALRRSRARDGRASGRVPSATEPADAAGLTTTDLAIRGISVELVRLSDHPPADLDVTSTESRVAREHEAELVRLLHDARVELAAAQERRHETELALAARDAQLAAVQGELARLRTIESGVSFRLGRALTLPLRWARDRWRRHGSRAAPGGD